MSSSDIASSEMDVLLLKEELVPFLNLAIQALYYCPHIEWRFNKIFITNTDLEKLKLLQLLFKNIRDYNEQLLTPAQKDIVNAWNNIDGDTVFDFLTNILNEVYDEIRHLRVLSSMDSWLHYRLPLRIILKYEIFCDCGYNEMSQGQSELSISMRSTSINTSVQRLVYKYFQTMTIEGKVCNKKDCLIEQGNQKRKLSCPLPETLCLYIVRHHTNYKVSFTSELIIKRKYCIVDPGKDISYLLTSVVSQRDKVYYIKVSGEWYSTSDMFQVVDIANVEPYLWFFEIKHFDKIAEDGSTEIPMPLIDFCVNNYINNIIQSLSSCYSFVTWLNYYSEEPEMNIITTVLQLCNNTSSISKEDKLVNINVIKTLNEYNGLGVYSILEALFNELIKDVNSMEKDSDRDTHHSPYLFHLSSLIMCGCGYKTLIIPESKISLNLQIVSNNENIDVQVLVDDYFQEKEDKKHNCFNRICAVNNVSTRVVMHHPLPTMLCVELNHTMDSFVNLKEELIIKEEYFCVNDKKKRRTISSENRLYYLRAAIISDQSYCYRKINNQWFYVNENSTKVVTLEEILLSDSYLLFYDSSDFKNDVKSELDGRRVSKENDHIGNNNSFIHGIIHSLSCCTKFIEWLNYLPCNDEMMEILTLKSLLCIVNQVLEYDNNVDNDTLQYWSETGTNSYDAIQVILNGIVVDLMRHSSISKVTAPLIIYNFCTQSSDLIETKNIKDIVLLDLFNNEEVKPLQLLIYECFEIWYGFDELYFKSAKNDSKMPLSEGLPDTIGFHFEDSWFQDTTNNVALAKSIIIKNKSCSKSKSCLSEYMSCCKRYHLRSFMDMDGHCCKVMNERLSKVTEGGYVTLDEEELLTLQPTFIMYESE